MRNLSLILALAGAVALAGCGDAERSEPRPSAPVRPLGVAGPDLILTQFDVTSITSTTVSYSWTIQNVGDAPADLEGPTGATNDNVSVQAFLSQDTIFNNAGDLPAGGTVVGSSPIGLLNPGETRSGSFSSSVTADPCGFAYLVLMVDWGGVVLEGNEANNTLATPIECCPDLVVDIKPGSDVNPVNPKSKGVIPVAILGSADLDVADIDWSTIAFGPGGAHDAHKSGGHLEDVNGDGYVDLVLHFRTQETGLHAGDTEACLTATLDNGCALSDCDQIVTVPAPELSGP